MAYDDELANRVRQLMPGDGAVDERSMFGGLAFLLGGHMAVVASGKGGLMVRTHSDVADECVASGSARFAEMRGRKMRGWIRIEDREFSTKRRLQRWVDMGTEFTETLPPK